MGNSARLYRLRQVGVALPLGIALLTSTESLYAQTDYYNTDVGRPVRIEDATPVERYAFELQAAPLRFERSDGGAYTGTIEPELAYGILPRTHFELAFPLELSGGAGVGGTFGLAGIAIGMLHNLNAESQSFPAFALGADVLLPIGELAPERAYSSIKGIATRTLRFARFHVNGEVTLGRTPEEGESAGDVSHWMTGIAVDKAFPLQSALLIGDVFVEQPLDQGEELRWTVEAGVRYQLSPFFSLDAGIGRRLTGDDRSWFVTLGAARAFAIRSLIFMPRQ